MLVAIASLSTKVTSSVNDDVGTSMKLMNVCVPNLGGSGGSAILAAVSFCFATRYISFEQSCFTITVMLNCLVFHTKR
jgi:hypothetical protein